MTDDDIDTSDIPPLTDEFFKKAKWRTPFPAGTKITIEVLVRLEPDLLAWFKSQEGDYEERMRRVLREYADAQKAA